MNTIQLSSYFKNHLIDNWDQKISIVNSRAAVIRDGVFDSNIRDCIVRNVDFFKQPELYNEISTQILNILDALMFRLKVDINRTLEIQHTTYNVGNFYKKHVDIPPELEASRSVQRKISMVIPLSSTDEYTGGELMIANQVIPQPKGSVIIFSPRMLHEVKPVLSGIRKSLVIWALGPAWR